VEQLIQLIKEYGESGHIGTSVFNELMQAARIAQIESK
jgi:hypothetical protein